jgi:DNA-binding MarR family transcriptional regulator
MLIDVAYGETKMVHDELVEQAFALIDQFGETGLGRMATQWADQNLSLAQISLLFVLAHSDAASVREIAERLHIGQSAASLLVDRLVQANLAKRTEDPGDRRRAIVCLTTRGEELMGRNRVGRKYLHAWLNEQDDAHLAMIRETFTALGNIQNKIGSVEEFSDDSE